jgi:hypothetical protein
VPSGTSVVNAIATKPTSPSDTAIHTPLPSTTIMKPSRISDSSTIPGVENISRPRPG